MGFFVSFISSPLALDGRGTGIRGSRRVSGDSVRVRISAPSADITPKFGVYQHQVTM
jgi:hypothetical protein